MSMVDNRCYTVIGIDFAQGQDRTVITCAKCKATHEVINGILPEIGWCGCGAANRLEKPKKGNSHE